MRFLLSLLLLFASLRGVAATDTLLAILNRELQREFAQMQQNPTPPYYLSLRVEEEHSTRIGTSFGKLTHSEKQTRRTLTPEVRVGNYTLDNTHEIRGSESYANRNVAYETTLPVENEDLAIRQTIWRACDAALKDAENRYEKVRANIAVKVKEEDNSPDFAIAQPEKYSEPPLEFEFNCAEWEEKLRAYSQVFEANKDVISARATLQHKWVRKYFVSSEGTEVVHNLRYTNIHVSAMVKADNGMELPLQKSYFAFSPEDLPASSQIIAELSEISAKLTALKNAPEVEPYAGPALLSASAAGVFFHEIFGHRIEGQRLRSETDGQTFKKKANEVILPPHLSVSCAPRRQKFGTQDLNGYYPYDEQGVASQEVVLVKNGVLKNFLMSRVPIQNFEHSNGHARAEAGKIPMSRQSNLLVETNAPKTDKELKTLLLKEMKRQGKPYGYYFASVVGGFTNTGRYRPNSFNVTPTEVYRVYADGRPDELVRGVDLVGTPLSMFSQIDYAGDTPLVFTGQCGAESGQVPVSAIAPAILVRTIEVQKKAKSQSTPPLQERP